MISGDVVLNSEEEMMAAGRALARVKSVNGKGTKTISPR
jgi:hypothetical protein